MKIVIDNRREFDSWVSHYISSRHPHPSVLQPVSQVEIVIAAG
jgi:hypothetical protein